MNRKDTICILGVLFACVGLALGQGEACADATAIGSLPYDATGTTCGHVDNYDAICPYDTPGSPDVVYAFTPSSDITVNISLCNDGTNYDTKLYVFAGDCAGTPIACNDDACSTTQMPDPFVSELPGVALAGGITYYIVVDGFGGDCGDYHLTVAQGPAAPPNDQCQNMQAVALVNGTPLTFTGNNLNATMTNDCIAFGQYPAVWHGFTTTATMDITLDYCGTNPTFGAAWLNLAIGCSATCSFTDVGTWERTTCGDGNIRIHWIGLPAGEYWYPVLLDPVTGSAGPYTLHVLGQTVPPPTGACCFWTGICQIKSAADCATAGGQYDGDGTSCTPNPCPPPNPRLTLEPDAICYKAGDTVTIQVWMRDIVPTIVGGQFFLFYDPAWFSFFSADPAATIFTLQVAEFVNTQAGTIDYAVGIPLGGVGTNHEANMAVLTFTALVDTCSVQDLIVWRQNAPPSQLSDNFGMAVLPALIDLTGTDTTPPVITGCPQDITVNAEAGTCSAHVSWTPPAATDNCTLESFTSTNQPGDLFPQGSTTVTYTALDLCGNETTCSFHVIVQPFNTLVVNVELSPNIDTFGTFPQTLTRCITFELWDCSPPNALPDVVFNTPVTFTITAGSPNVALGSATLTNVPCGKNYTCITARDRLHTLRRTADTTDGNFGIVGTEYVAGFAGDPTTGGDWLVGGNLNDDAYVDILDFGVFSWQYNTNYGTGDTTCSTAPPHADISGDGIVTSADFTFIQINFLKTSEASCCSLRSMDSDQPITRISVAELRDRGLGELAAGDINGDGWLDVQDMILFAQGQPPSHRGDVNCDGVVNFHDINPFVLALTGQTAYEAAFPGCRWLNADCNSDGVVNFADINPFVALLSE